MKTSVLVAVAANGFLVGCAAVDVTDPSSRYYDIPTTSMVVVQQAIVIPPDSAHAVLQGGDLVTTGSLSRYEPFCEIEVNDVLETEQLVRPGRFAIKRAVRQQQLGAVSQPARLAGLNVAGIGVGIRFGTGGAFGLGIGASTGMGLHGGDAAFALNAVHLRLASTEQPNVRELRCAAGWDLLPNAVYPTLAEMRSALGAFVSIEIP